jgi:hypothetical protein
MNDLPPRQSRRRWFQRARIAVEGFEVLELPHPDQSAFFEDVRGLFELLQARFGLPDGEGEFRGGEHGGGRDFGLPEGLGRRFAHESGQVELDEPHGVAEDLPPP